MTDKKTEKIIVSKGDTNESSVETGDSEHRIHCLSIIGQIEGHSLLGDSQKATKYEQLLPLLVSIEESREIEGLLILLNTAGGDVEAGLCIAEMIAGMSKPTVSLVLGGGHSIGMPLAVSAKRSFIVPSATMIIHPVRMSGVVVGAPQTYYYFERMRERILDFIERNSHAKRDRLCELMMKPDELATDIGTLLDGSGAVAEGIIDEVGNISSALTALHAMAEADKSKAPAKKRAGKSEARI
ncbi:MAG: ATP-dependent Clp protease proteolytic subunit [Eubacteriales bacterium]